MQPIPFASISSAEWVIFGYALVMCGLVTLAVAVAAFDYVCFSVLPKWAARKYGQADPARLARYLERLVAIPALAAQAHKLQPRLDLSRVCLAQGQHAEAATHFRGCLALALASPGSP